MQEMGKDYSKSKHAGQGCQCLAKELKKKKGVHVLLSNCQLRNIVI